MDATSKAKIQFANEVLRIMESEEEWGSDTLGLIASDAVGRGLARIDEAADGAFVSDGVLGNAKPADIALADALLGVLPYAETECSQLWEVYHQDGDEQVMDEAHEAEKAVHQANRVLKALGYSADDEQTAATNA